MKMMVEVTNLGIIITCICFLYVCISSRVPQHKRDFPHHTILKMYFRCSAPKLNTAFPNRGNGWQHYFAFCFEANALTREIEHEWCVCAHGRSRNKKAVATSCPLLVSYCLLWLVVVVGSFLSELGRSNPIKTRGMTRINIWFRSVKWHSLNFTIIDSMALIDYTRYEIVTINMNIIQYNIMSLLLRCWCWWYLSDDDVVMMMM